MKRKHKTIKNKLKRLDRNSESIKKSAHSWLMSLNKKDRKVFEIGRASCRERV